MLLQSEQIAVVELGRGNFKRLKESTESPHCEPGKISIPSSDNFPKQILLPAFNVFFSCSTDVLSHKFQSICMSQGELVSLLPAVCGQGSDIKKKYGTGPPWWRSG